MLPWVATGGRRSARHRRRTFTRGWHRGWGSGSLAEAWPVVEGTIGLAAAHLGFGENWGSARWLNGPQRRLSRRVLAASMGCWPPSCTYPIRRRAGAGAGPGVRAGRVRQDQPAGRLGPTWPAAGRLAVAGPGRQRSRAVLAPCDRRVGPAAAGDRRADRSAASPAAAVV